MMLTVDDWIFTFLTEANLYNPELGKGRNPNGIKKAITQPINTPLPRRHVVRFGTSEYYAALEDRQSAPTDPDPDAATRGRRAPFVAIRFVGEAYDRSWAPRGEGDRLWKPITPAPGQNTLVTTPYPTPVTLSYDLEIISPKETWATQIRQAIHRELQPRRTVELPVYAFGVQYGPDDWPVQVWVGDSRGVMSIGDTSQEDAFAGGEGRRVRVTIPIRVQAWLLAPERLVELRRRYTSAVVEITDADGNPVETFNA